MQIAQLRCWYRIRNELTHLDPRRRQCKNRGRNSASNANAHPRFVRRTTTYAFSPEDNITAAVVSVEKRDLGSSRVLLPPTRHPSDPYATLMPAGFNRRNVGRHGLKSTRYPTLRSIDTLSIISRNALGGFVGFDSFTRREPRNFVLNKRVDIVAPIESREGEWANRRTRKLDVDGFM